ncbi:MAG TPA: flagellar assembly protein FliW [Syntrophus sp. (in: bacteria)]|jgi:flagellar assembly factor FliW|nr:flagellar assembly protein FliW [Syntrophus sp. (in: bacteria)]
MKIKTSRFGEIEVDELKIIEMRGGILGYNSLKRFVMIVHEEGSPFHWFQSLEDGSIAFITMNPFIAKSDYEPEIDDQTIEMLEVEREEDIELMAILTIRSEPAKMTANLRAPLVINKQKKLASQVVLEDEQYPVRYNIA